MALLRGVPAFARLPGEVLEELAALLAEEHYAAGAVVVTEGEAGDRLYLIAEGSAELSAAGPVPLAALWPGELFGEVALLEPGGRRQATISAVAPLLLLSLDAPDFHRLLEDHLGAGAAFEEAAEEMLVAKFLKQASPFSALDGRRLRRLAARLKRLSVPAGEAIVWQGEPGEECYLLRRPVRRCCGGRRWRWSYAPLSSARVAS